MNKIIYFFYQIHEFPLRIYCRHSTSLYRTSEISQTCRLQDCSSVRRDVLYSSGQSPKTGEIEFPQLRARSSEDRGSIFEIFTFQKRQEVRASQHTWSIYVCCNCVTVCLFVYLSVFFRETGIGRRTLNYLN